jgi:hypothetical protein
MHKDIVIRETPCFFRAMIKGIWVKVGVHVKHWKVNFDVGLDRIKLQHFRHCRHLSARSVSQFCNRDFLHISFRQEIGIH